MVCRYIEYSCIFSNISSELIILDSRFSKVFVIKNKNISLRIIINFINSYICTIVIFLIFSNDLRFLMKISMYFTNIDFNLSFGGLILLILYLYENMKIINVVLKILTFVFCYSN